jgi:hypothetical protein
MESNSIALTANSYSRPQTIYGARREAPTARPIPAWGEALGTIQLASKSANGAPYTSLGRSPRYEHTKPRGLKARPIAISIPQIPLVKLNPIFLKKCAKFIFKIHSSMVLRLPINVINQLIQIRRPNRKRPVPALPCEPSQRRRLSFQPFRRGCLKLLYQVRDIRLARQSNRKMDVVGNATNPITFAVGIADNCRQIGVKIRAHNVIDHRRAIFRTENHMDKQIRERLCHRDEYRSGLQPSLAIGPDTWGFTPCWHSGAPSALQQP